ncbi:MAG TPA: HAD-IA family hydrolase [Gemmatimonadales bacterium]|nr:HAD-IA family hydrolase [Gemmatimonadales bacterium]
MRFRAILFDAGGTLLFLDHARIAERLNAACGARLSKEGLDAAAPGAAQALERAAGTDGERAARYLEVLCLAAGLPASRWLDARGELYAMHRERHLWSAGDDRTAAALARLRESGIVLGVVSNSDGRVDDALRAAGLRDYFDVVVDSSVVGVEKPDPRIFLAALEQLGIPAGDALYVGDVFEVDVVGARSAGMAAALVGPNAGAADIRSAPTVAELMDELFVAAAVERAGAGNPIRNPE